MKKRSRWLPALFGSFCVLAFSAGFDPEKAEPTSASQEKDSKSEGESQTSSAAADVETASGRSGSRLLHGLGERRLRLRDAVARIAWSPDGRWIATTSLNDARQILYIWDASTGEEFDRLILPASYDGWAEPIVFLPDGKNGEKLLAATGDGHLVLRDVEAKSRVTIRDH